jgi:hypothetical protein
MLGTLLDSVGVHFEKLAMTFLSWKPNKGGNGVSGAARSRVWEAEKGCHVNYSLISLIRTSRTPMPEIN